ncbi:MAG TPA: MFS transporter [Vicinamibacterales bacterium]|nr:MFS transporter [Vicinamibacterales bacterium]
MASQTQTAPPAPMTFREVLGLVVMRRVWFAQVVSLLGDFLALFAVIAYVTYGLKGSAAQVTGVQIAYMAPYALMGPLSGVFVDRWPIKPTLVSSDLIRAVLVLLLFFTTSLWQIYAVLVALSCVSTFFGPAQSVTIRTYVPAHGLIAANALMQTAMVGNRIIGPTVAGILVAAFGANVCYGLDVVSFLASAALIGTVAIVRPKATAQPGAPADRGRVAAVIHDMGVGMRFIVHHAALSFVVLAMAAGMFVIGCFGPLIAIYVREWLHASAFVFGIVSAMVGAGMIFGMPVVRRLSGTVSNSMLVLGGLAGIGLGALLLGAFALAPTAMLGTFTLGFAFAGIIVPAQTLMQRETPHELLGRISSTVMSVVFFAQLIGLVLSGVLAQAFGVRMVFFVCAGIAWVLTGAGKWLLGTDRHAKGV